MSRTIWVVMGSTGEYSDHSTWFVCAYESEAAALKHADDATKRALVWHREECEHGEKLGSWCDACGRENDYGNERLRKHMGTLDPRSSMDYTGTDYVALPVELRDAK